MERPPPWASSVLVATSVIAILAKIAGVVVAPGMRGLAPEKTVNAIETVAGGLTYLLAALLVGLVFGASYELSRARGVHVIARGAVVAVSGLILALVAPSFVERLSTGPSLVLSAVTSLVTLVAGAVVLRSSATRAMGALLVLLALAALLRVVAYETSGAAIDRVSQGLLEVAHVIATIAVVLEGFATLVAAAWIGTRSRWRGRFLANLAILAAFAITWLAAKNSVEPGVIEIMLRSTLPTAGGVAGPYLGSIAAFLVPAGVLLACVALALGEPAAVVAPLVLALLSNGAFDVPLQALLVAAAAQWAMLAVNGDTRTVSLAAATSSS